MTGQVDFNSHTDALVGRTTGLVNLTTPGWRQGRAVRVPEAAALAVELAEALHAPVPAREVEPLCRLGAALRPVYEATDRGDLDAAAGVVNDLLARYRPTPYLERHDEQPWHLHFHGGQVDDPSGWGGGCSVALATVLGGEYADRLGVCGAERCDRVFVDVSRNGRRRFCSVACQNRVKAAAHRARQR